jgi:superfamily II DNA or RNA helicase
MTKYYIYIRHHESYQPYNAVKLGITTCIGSRDSTYATSEIQRGRFINVFELSNLSRKYPFSRNPLEHLEKLLHIYLKNLKKHIYINSGREFFNNDIISVIPSYLELQSIEYITLTNDEISSLIDEYRLNEFYKKLSSTAREMIQLKLLEWLSRIRQNKLKPLPHQQPILDNILEFYSYNSIGKLYWACGLGKALLALFIAQVINAKNILIGVPSVYLQGQMKNEILRLFAYITKTNQKNYILCIGGEDETSTTNIEIIKKFIVNSNTLAKPRFVITTFDSCHILASLASLAESIIKFDFKIGDEAHHLVIYSNSDDVSDKSYVKFHDIPSHKTLYMTATPKIINYRKSILESITHSIPIASTDKIIYSMDDTRQFGNLIDSKSIKWAIDNKKITDFKVYVLYNTIHEMRAIARHSMGKDKIDDKNMELFTAAFMTLKSLERHHDLTHILIYTNTTENSDLVVRYMLDILEYQQLNIANLSSEDIFIKSLHSNTARHNFQKEVETFTSARIGIISCVYIFGEGFDLPRLNGVAMAENMISPIRTTQCALRPNRLDRNNPDKLAYIIIPYLDREECGICNQSFKKCFNVINSLRNDDDILECKIQVSSLVIDGNKPQQEPDIPVIPVIPTIEPDEPVINPETPRIIASRKTFRITLKDNPLELEKLKLRLKHSTHLKRNESIEKDELEYMRLINRQLSITSREMYFDSSIRARFSHWIENPKEYFGKHRIWQGWYHYLCVDTSRYPANKEEWLEYCVSREITNFEEYLEKQKNDVRLPEYPEELYIAFVDIQYELRHLNSTKSRRRRT